MLADYLGLSSATISLVLNGSPVADSIPQKTKDRVFAAARDFNYRPNFVARSLRTQRSYMIGVLVPEVSEGYASTVMGGIEDQLLQEGYFYLVASHRHMPDLIEEYPQVLQRRSVEGLIAVDTPWTQQISIPVVSVSGRGKSKGITQIVLDHERAAELALEHLYHLGHRRVAFIKGQSFSSDTEIRWNAIVKAAKSLRLEIRPELLDNYRSFPVLFVVPVAVVASLLAMFLYRRRGQDKGAFLSSCAYLVFMLVGAAAAVYPNLLTSTTDPKLNITVANAASGAYALSRGLIWWGFGMALAVGYFVFVYRMFRGKVTEQSGGSGYL